MNSITNVLLFCVSIVLLVMAFVAVNVYVKKLSLEDLGDMLTPSNIMAGIDLALDAKDSGAKSANLAESKSDSNLWSSIFAKKEIPHYRYPAPEMFIALDFSGKNRTDILQISNLDSYKFFCLKEILKSNNIQFTYKIQNQKATLEIVLDSAQKRANLLSELKRYNIAYRISAS